MVMDAFKTHFTDDVVAAMLIAHTGVVKLAAGCTSKVQLLGACINRSLKFILRECWKDCVGQVVKDAGDDANNNPSFKLNTLTRQDILNCLHRGYVFLQKGKAMVQRSFEVCGITTTNPGLVYNYDFLKRIMTNDEVNSDQTDDDDMFVFNIC